MQNELIRSLICEAFRIRNHEFATRTTVKLND